MTNEELLKNAGEAQPEMFEKVANMLALTERLEPEFAIEASQDINEILDTTQRLMVEYDEKVKVAHGGGGGGGHGGGGHGFGGGGGLKGWGRDVGTAAATGLAANLLYSVASDIYDVTRRSLTKSHNYKAILNQNPELATRFDKKDLRRSYNTLHRYAPEFTSDPSLGGHILSAMAETPENQLNVIKTLIDSGDKLLAEKGRRFGQAKITIPTGRNGGVNKAGLTTEE